MIFKKGFLFVVIYTICHAGMAQSYVGVHFGVNSGKFSGDSPRKFNYVGKNQYNAGIDFNLRLKKDLFLSVSPSYARSGSVLQYPYENIEEEIKEYRDSIDLKLDMFTLPFYLNIISDNDRWQFLGGIELGFPLSLVADDSADEIDLTGEINDVFVGMFFGVGYRIPIERSYLTINLGYSQGLTNLANNLNDPDSLMPRIRITRYSITTVYMLPLGRDKHK